MLGILSIGSINLFEYTSAIKPHINAIHYLFDGIDVFEISVSSEIITLK